MAYRHSTQTVIVPKHDKDIYLKFPNGREIRIMYRENTDERGKHPTLDIVFDKQEEIIVWQDVHMTPAPAVRKQSHVRKGDQICIGFDSELFSR